ncbi:MAG TPA: isoprenylcysteine carboxylmethyltransferase family protein [Polyangiaceae bacterium]|nr:isoprenylcysteine carboxylmethyltransferase family protein [Polyangiaceae bacterium]
MVTSQALYLGFLGLLGVERCIELSISRVNAKRAFAKGAFETGRVHYRVMAALHTAFLLSCGLEVVLLDRPFPGWSGFVALLVALLAQLLRYAAVVTLGERWNVRIIVWPSRAPITGGLYRFVRHPNYVAVIVELLAVPLVHGAFLTAIFFTACNAALLTVRIREEERALGAGYAAAFRGKPRFIPRSFSG